MAARKRTTKMMNSIKSQFSSILLLGCAEQPKLIEPKRTE